MSLDLPLMANNITRADLDLLIEFLRGQPRLTQGDNVRLFEEEWSRWLGVKHSVFLNSGASANLLTIAALRHLRGPGGEVIVSPLNWVSDIAAVIQNGFTPVFVDINPRTLAMADHLVCERLTSETRAVLLTHIQGFNGLTARLHAELGERGIPLIEDVCESHGASFNGCKLGTWGWASNFSFYFAHHMSTIEGGMACTNDPELYQALRMLRSHGMVREASDVALRARYAADNPGLSPDFIFAMPAYNCRNTEIGAVIGRSQLSRLDRNNQRRCENLSVFLAHLDPMRFRTEFDTDGACNYAFNVILREKDDRLRDALEQMMGHEGIEFRRGSSGGGNQLRQPYLRHLVPARWYEQYPETEHIHFYAWYVGNYPELPHDKIIRLCELLNQVRA